MTQINLSFPDENYSSSNKPSAVTLKNDLTILENSTNAQDTRIEILENEPAPVKTIAVPAGAYFPWAGTTAPAHYLMCTGQEVSRTTFADLYTAIGDTYGAGDGSTTFNVPDMGNKAPAGVGDHALGEDFGEKEHTQTEAEMAKHKHIDSASASSTVTDPEHSHPYKKPNDAGHQRAQYGGGDGPLVDPNNGGVTGKSTTGITVATSIDITELEKGNNEAMNVEGRRIATNFIIKSNNE